MTKSSLPKDDINQEYGYDDTQDSSFDETQASPDYVTGEVAPTVAQKLKIIVRMGKAGYEATIPSMPEVKKKVSKLSLEHAASELVKSIKLNWDDFKDVTSFRDQDAGRKVYEYTGEPF